ncbi:MAG: hypothetical protein U9N49_11000 [Campylobacterota bacterium]|nr:hypothetical protein [Campylobacterota bacterium]
MGGLLSLFLNYMFRGFSLGRVGRFLFLVSMMGTFHFILTNTIELFLDHWVKSKMNTFILPDGVCWVITRLDLFDLISFYLSALMAVSMVRYFLNTLIPKFLD